MAGQEHPMNMQCPQCGDYMVWPEAWMSAEIPKPRCERCDRRRARIPRPAVKHQPGPTEDVPCGPAGASAGGGGKIDEQAMANCRRCGSDLISRFVTWRSGRNTIKSSITDRVCIGCRHVIPLGQLLEQEEEP